MIGVPYVPNPNGSRNMLLGCSVVISLEADGWENDVELGLHPLTLRTEGRGGRPPR